MFKRIMVVILLMMVSFNVSALSYTDYSDFSEYDDKFIETSDLVDVKTERRYKYYKLERENGPFSETSSLEYPFIDYDTYKYTDFSELSFDMPEEKEGREIVQEWGYKYAKLKDINFIEIKNFWINSFKIEEFKLLYDGKELDYDISNKSTGSFDSLENDESIYINLPCDLDISLLDVVLRVSGDGVNDYRMMFRTGYNDEIYTNNFYTFDENFSLLWDSKDVHLINYVTTMEEFYSSVPLEISNIVAFRRAGPVYKYRDTVYQTYKEKKVYYDDYLSSAYMDYIYKDDLLFKDFYAYRVRCIIDDSKENDDVSSDVSIDFSDNVLDTKDTLDTNDTLSKSDFPLVTSSVISASAKEDNLSVVSSKPSVPLKKEEVSYESSNDLFYYFGFILLFILLILILSKVLKKRL